jgi:hypothetical protein
MKYIVKVEKTDEGYAIETYLVTVEELTKDKVTRLVEVAAYASTVSVNSVQQLSREYLRYNVAGR